jgi:hypothetical protein
MKFRRITIDIVLGWLVLFQFEIRYLRREKRKLKIANLAFIVIRMVI